MHDRDGRPVGRWNEVVFTGVGSTTAPWPANIPVAGQLL